MLRAEASTEAGDEDASVMVLTADDELAYGRVLGVIAESGEAFVVDGYLDAQELVHILKDSNASRFLVSNKLSAGRLAQLAIQIRLTPPNEDGGVRELRRADFHDRYLIGDHKGLRPWFITERRRKKHHHALEMPGVAAQTIRAHAESLWEAAEVVAFTLQHDEDGLVDEGAHAEGSLEDDGAPDSRPKVTRSEGGVYRHDGCPVRHRSQQAAERCTNGG